MLTLLQIWVISLMRQGCLDVNFCAIYVIFWCMVLLLVFWRDYAERRRQICVRSRAKRYVQVSWVQMMAVLAIFILRQRSMLLMILMVQVRERGLPLHLNSFVLCQGRTYRVRLKKWWYCLCLSWAEVLAVRTSDYLSRGQMARRGVIYCFFIIIMLSYCIVQ